MPTLDLAWVWDIWRTTDTGADCFELPHATIKSQGSIDTGHFPTDFKGRALGCVGGI